MGGGGQELQEEVAKAGWRWWQKAREEVVLPGEEVPSARAVSICATTSKLFRAINLRQLRSPRYCWVAIAGWRGALRDFRLFRNL